MAYTEEQDEEDDELEEFSDEDYPEDTEGDDLIHCPQCRREISALCDLCPRCGHWIMESDRRQMAWTPTEPKGMKVAAVLVIALMVAFFVAGGVLLWFLGRGS